MDIPCGRGIFRGCRHWQAGLEFFDRITNTPPRSSVAAQVGSTSDNRFSHVDSAIARVRTHDAAGAERASLTTCDLSEATRFCCSLEPAAVLLNGSQVCEVLGRDDLPFKAVEALLAALADSEAADAAAGAAAPVYAAARMSPLLLAPRGARALLQRAGCNKAPRQGDVEALKNSARIALARDARAASNRGPPVAATPRPRRG